jgi:hypothetical protein
MDFWIFKQVKEFGKEQKEGTVVGCNTTQSCGGTRFRSLSRRRRRQSRGVLGGSMLKQRGNLREMGGRLSAA